jgi:hypothetical protein
MSCPYYVFLYSTKLFIPLWPCNIKRHAFAFKISYPTPSTKNHKFRSFFGCLWRKWHAGGIETKQFSPRQILREFHFFPCTVFCQRCISHVHVAMSIGREELKTLSFAFEACRSTIKDYRPHVENSRYWETNKKTSMRCVTGVLLDLHTSFSQSVYMVMDSSSSICTTSPHIIPNQSPWSSDAVC